jgi:hypothetical protein
MSGDRAGFPTNNKTPVAPATAARVAVRSPTVADASGNAKGTRILTFSPAHVKRQIYLYAHSKSAISLREGGNRHRSLVQHSRHRDPNSSAALVLASWLITHKTTILVV